MDIGSTIKNIRTRRGLKQNDLASQCELTQAYLSKIENNQKEPTLSVLKRIAAELNVPLPILFFQSLTMEDIDPKKREPFEFILPSIKGMLDPFI